MHTTLTSKGQMTLPAAVRSRLGLEAGDQLSVTVLDTETIVLKRRISRSVGALRGLLPRPAKALTLREIDDGVAAHLGRKSRRRCLPTSQVNEGRARHQPAGSTADQ